MLGAQMSSQTLMIVAVVVVLLTVWVVSAVFRTSRKLREQGLQALSAIRCPKCGNTYGAAAAQVARERYLAQCREELRHHRNPKKEIGPFWTVNCPACMNSARFEYFKRQLQT